VGDTTIVFKDVRSTRSSARRTIVGVSESDAGMDGRVGGDLCCLRREER